MLPMYLKIMRQLDYINNVATNPITIETATHSIFIGPVTLALPSNVSGPLPFLPLAAVKSHPNHSKE